MLGDVASVISSTACSMEARSKENGSSGSRSLQFKHKSKAAGKERRPEPSASLDLSFLKSKPNTASAGNRTSSEVAHSPEGDASDAGSPRLGDEPEDVGPWATDTTALAQAHALIAVIGFCCSVDVDAASSAPR